MEGGCQIMSKQVDERVVEMRFDNAQFERNVSTSMSTLDKLKKSLNLDGAAKGLENVNAAAKSCDFSAMGNGIETIKAKFSALQVMAVTTLANITNSAVNAGKRMVSAITIEPIKAGFQEYETQMNAVQTILANTQKEGTNVKIVNKALDELNTYADKTIYNFTEMTRNIGTFTAAGVKLDTSVSSIKGIANLAAVSGSTSQQASTAMYQLSQAIASGTVKLMDWNSVVNAGMGGQVFQDALTRTSEHLKTGAKAAIKAKGSFRESLQTGWLTTEVLTQTLDQFATAADTQEEYEAAIKKFIDQGYSQEEAKQMADMAKTAGEAATKVKTFTQLIDTLKEALGSGWTTTWRLIIGDFEEAKTLWTEVSDYFSEAINKSSEARNSMLEEWADGGGRTMLIDSLKNAFEGLTSVVAPIKDAFREVFPPATSEQLLKITERVKDFTEKLKLSSENAERVKRVFKGLFSIFDLGKKVLTTFMKPLLDFSQSKGISNLADFLLEAAASVGDFFASINEGAKTKDILTNISDAFSNAFGGASKVFESAINGLRGFGNIFKSVFSWILKVSGKIGSAISKTFKWITENVSIGDIFAGLLSGSIFVTLKKFGGLLDKIKDTISNIFDKKITEGGIGDKFKNILDEVHNSLESFTSGIKIASLVSIAIAIGILSASLKSIASLKVNELSNGLFGIGTLLAMLSQSFKSLTKSLSKFDSKGVVKAGIAMIAMSIAIKILSKALVEIASLKFTDMLKGLLAIGLGLLELVGILKLLDKTKGSIKSAITMILVAETCKMLGEALASLASLSWDEIGRGLVAMGGALIEIAAITGLLGKLGGMSSLAGAISILIVAKTLDDIYEALKAFGSMSWDEIGRGLVAMGGALTELAVITGLLGKLGGMSSLAGAISILIVALALKPIGKVLSDIGQLSWGEIARGLVGMGGALTELAVITGLLGTLAPGTGLLGAATILIVALALKPIGEVLSNIGQLSWSEIARGLVGMGGALTELAVITGLLGNFGGLGALLGAGTILLAVQGLGDLADALKKFGEMSWDEIGRGLTAMGAALGEVALGSLLNTLSGLGAKSISEVAEPLGTLADSVKKWADVTVPEDLSSQLGSLAAGIMKFTFGKSGAGAVSEVAEPLGTLADSVKKWADVVVPENIGDQLDLLADGVMKFTLAGIGAKGLNQVAEPLGTLADSVKKWADVVVPEGIDKQLTSLANGVTSFSFAFAGGWSIAQIIEPLGNLADSVKKWADVKVPEGIEQSLTSIANGIKQFSIMDAAKISAIDEPLQTLSASFRNFSNITGTGENLVIFATNIKESANELNNIKFDDIKDSADDLSSAIASIKKAMESISKIISSSESELESAMETAVSGLAAVVESKKSDIGAAGENLASALENVIISKKPYISSAFESIVSGCDSAVLEKTSSMESAGKNLGEGLIRGINSKKLSVYYAGFELGKLAVRGENDGQKSNSPSKLTIKAGKWLGEGLVIGMQKLSHNVYQSGYNLGETATDAISSTISRISDVLNSDIDAQPTIRPVLDLSNISAGAGTINRMFGTNPSIGVLTKVGSISSMMNSQNGTDKEVISAIKDLGRKLDDKSGDTYNFGDFTYDDSSNVSDAVRTLVRAVKIEGRR